MEPSRPNLVPAFVAIVIVAAVAFGFRHTIAGWFQSKYDAQTVVLRQTASPSPTTTPTATPAPSSSAKSIADVTPRPSVTSDDSLPTAGPEEDIVAAFAISGGTLAYAHRAVLARRTRTKRTKLDIL
jgi:hypothetical protein